jgi:signal transduction histidine kinase
MRHKLSLIAEAGLDARLIARLIALQEAAVEQAAKEREPLTALQEADLEDELIERMEQLGVTAPHDLGPVFAAAGLDTAWLDGVIEQVGRDSVDALRWLGYTLETEALMDEIEDATSRISTLVAAVKQYSYLDQATHQDVDLHPGLDSTVVMLGHKLSGVTVERDYDRTLPAVPAYAAELNQVWTNLIDNAVDAMGGRGVVRLRTYRDGDFALVDVSDDGPGIHDEIRDRVFEPFVTTKAAGKGSGLGLENAKRIVERRHGGSLSFTTGPDGTTFTVRLPLNVPTRQGASS